MHGTGLKYQVADGTGQWVEFHKTNPHMRDEAQYNFDFDDDRGVYSAPPYAGGKPVASGSDSGGPRPDVRARTAAGGDLV